jgi:hydroxyacylglutathione hydrolase
MRVEQLTTPGLGHQSYLVAGDTTSEAAVIDPRRDIDVYLEAASRLGVRITKIFETHIHNDYVSGACELAARTGATLVSSADAPVSYAVHGVRDGDRIPVGAVTFTVMATPGHTPEHVSYVAREGEDESSGVLFSGGSLLVGSVGRTDLMGHDLTSTLTSQQYHSVSHLLAALPPEVRVYPTHGGGSFCGAGNLSSAISTTIGHERVANVVVLAGDEADFVTRTLAGFGPYPAYYAHMRPINLAGPRPLGALSMPPRLSPAAVRARMDAGTRLVDGRPADDYAALHIPGSLGIEVEEDFATYVGWLLPFNAPLLLVVPDEAALRELVTQLVRIGFDRVEGVLDGGLNAWREAGYPTASYPRISVAELAQRIQQRDPLTVVDVRRPSEWEQGHLQGAMHQHIGELPAHLHELPERQVIATLCRSGFRASIAASLIAGTGREVIAVRGGMPDWVALGEPVE